MQNYSENLDFGAVASSLQIDPLLKETFRKYLAEIFYELSMEDEANKTKIVTKYIFAGYLELPSIISEKIFNSFDIKNKGSLESEDFIEGMFELYAGTYERTINCTFNIFDFDKDGKILIEDVSLLLSYFHQVRNEDDLNPLNKLVENFFSGNKIMSYENYEEIIENNNCNIFLLLLCNLYEKKPFDDEILQYYREKEKTKKRTRNEQKNIKLPQLRRESIRTDNVLKFNKIVQPCRDLKLYLNQNFNYKINLNHRKIASTNVLRFENSIISPVKAGLIINESEHMDEDFNLLKNNNFFNSPKKNNGTPKYEVFCYKLSTSFQLRKFKLIIINKHAFYFKLSKKENSFHLLGVHYLSNSFANPCPEVTTTNHVFHPLQITSYLGRIKNSRSMYFFKKAEEMKTCLDEFRKVMEIRNIENFYDVSLELGKGQFGLVKLGVNKITREKVAVKIISKTKLSAKDADLIKSEIDIMQFLKNSNNQNIVKMIDLFENETNIYIVMEYLSGGNLHTYLTEKGEILTEIQVKEIMRQIVDGVRYLHKFGIIHRDLKPENILLVEKTNKAPKLKIMDFGLSKVIASHEKTKEGYGSLCYSAPEILSKKNYDHKIDVWSIGVIAYFLLSGLFPFDDVNDDIYKIAKKITSDELQFPDNTNFIYCSDQVKDFISKCLEKKINSRFDINQVVRQTWFL